MMLRLVPLYLRSMIRLRDLAVILVAGLGLILAGNFWFGAPFTPRGALGTWLLDTDGSLTYGLAIAFIGATACVAATLTLDEHLHAYGYQFGITLIARLIACAIIATLARGFVILVQFVAGVIDSLARAGHLIFGSPVPIDASVITGQLRVLAIYILAAFAGACVAIAIGNRVGAMSIAILSVGAYLPFMGSLYERAKTSVHVLAATPFGELRAILSGNAGIFGQSSSYQRLLDPALAATLFSVWMLLLVVVAHLRKARAITLKGSGPPRSLILGSGLALAVARESRSLLHSQARCLGNGGPIGDKLEITDGRRIKLP